MGYLKDNSIKAVCFDIDGTLYPGRQTKIYLLRSALFHPIFSFRYNRMRGIIRAEDGLSNGRRLSLADFRKREAKILFKRDRNDYISIYQRKLYKPWEKYIKCLKPFPHVKEAIIALKESGYKVGVLSDFPLGSKLKVLGLENLFDYECSSEDYGTLKPNKIPFLEMAKALDLNPFEILYVGDSYKKDIIGARNVGMKTLLIGDKREDTLVIPNYESFIDLML